MSTRNQGSVTLAGDVWVNIFTYLNWSDLSKVLNVTVFLNAILEKFAPKLTGNTDTIKKGGDFTFPKLLNHFITNGLEEYFRLVAKAFYHSFPLDIRTFCNISKAMYMNIVESIEKMKIVHTDIDSNQSLYLFQYIALCEFAVELELRLPAPGTRLYYMALVTPAESIYSDDIPLAHRIIRDTDTDTNADDGDPLDTYIDKIFHTMSIKLGDAKVDGIKRLIYTGKSPVATGCARTNWSNYGEYFDEMW